MTADTGLAFDLDELAGLFGDPLPISNPDVLDFWFRYRRSDGSSITLSISGYERSVAVIVRCSEEGATTAVQIDRCDSVRVLEPERKTLEIVGQSPPLRCFMALDGEATLDLSVPAVP
jgi:hypothetical protein